MVSTLRSSAAASGSVSGRGEGTVYTTHVASFRLGERQVKARSMDPLKIANGDRVAVAGIERCGVFHALAHVNLTTGLRGDQGWALVSLLVLLFFVFGAGGLVVSLQSLDRLSLAPMHGVVLAVACASLAGGAALLQNGARVFKAVQHLRRRAAQA